MKNGKKYSDFLQATVIAMDIYQHFYYSIVHKM